jgi:hypothetical protein
MPVYVYETIPDRTEVAPRRFEVKQSMSEQPLKHDPETGLPVRRLISGGFLMLKPEAGAAGAKSAAPKPSHSCGTGCGCFAAN